jgi:lipid-binding SYLF domain-containing protein
LRPGIAGIPKDLFQDCLGIVIISIVEAGFIFSGNVGTGIVVHKKPDGSWSPPCAVGITGMGWGLLAGASVKDVLMFLMDQESVQAVTTDNGLRVGAQFELTLGIGRTAKGDFDLSGRGVGVPISIAFTKGVFGGFNLEGSVVGARHNVNKTFYGKECTPRDILIEGRCAVPEGKVTLLPEVYEKLSKLAQGAVLEPDAAALEKKAAAHSHAEKASEEVNKADPDVVQVDAAAEAEKEMKME